MKVSKLVLIALACSGCRTFHTIDTGHLGLRFEPNGGLQREIVHEGRWELGWMCWLHSCGRMVDFDVTYSTKHEEVAAASMEGLGLDLRISVIYKPIVAELYELATQVSTSDYYNEVVGPEFRSAASSVFARHSYTELAANKEKIEDEIEADVRRRIKGKHVEITSITLEQIQYAPEIAAAVRARIVGEQDAARQRSAMEQEAARQKAQIENDALKQSLALERESARKKMEMETETTQKKFEIESAAQETELRLKAEIETKRNERAIAEEDAKLEKAKAAATIAKAHADAEAMTIMAHAKAEENRAATLAISPLTVQMEAYKALGQLGGSGTTVMLGDFSKLPTWLFPPGLAPGMFPGVGTPRVKAASRE